MQANTYSALLGRYYGVPVGRMMLVQAHPDLDGYVEHDLPWIRQEVELALEDRRKLRL